MILVSALEYCIRVAGHVSFFINSTISQINVINLTLKYVVLSVCMHECNDNSLSCKFLSEIYSTLTTQLNIKFIHHCSIYILYAIFNKRMFKCLYTKRTTVC